MKKRIIFIMVITFFIFLIIYKEHAGNSIAVYLDNIESTTIPDRNSNYIVDKVVCDNDVVGTWDNDKCGLLVTNLSKKSNCKMYFRNKKDITITYDSNYIKNNVFEKTYNIFNININGISNSKPTTSLSQIDDTYHYKFRSLGDEANPSNSSGFWLSLKSNRLSSDTKYMLSFEAKGNTKFNAIIGSEQIPSLSSTKIKNN